MLRKYFALEQNETNIRTEFLAGLTTFLTMAYIIFVNPAILAEAGMNKAALVTVTCLVTAFATIITGLFGKAPIAMAPGMGLNAFFAYTLVQTEQISWQTALGMVFISGLLFLLLSLFGLRKKLVEAIPSSLVSAISVGIGLFITFIGLQRLGVVVNNQATLVGAGVLTPRVLIGLGGLIVMVFLEVRSITGALLFGIVFATVVGAMLGYVDKPAQIATLNFDISQITFKLDIIGALKWGFFANIFSLIIMDLFDSIGTLVACCHQAGMVDEKGKVKGIGRLLGIDAIATMAGALFGTSTTTSYIESATGIAQGGKTGLTSVFTGLMFLLAIPFTPLVEVVPSYATAPALIMVGLFMMKEVVRIKFAELQQGFPAFIIVVMISFSYSISTGLAFGFISYVLIKILTGRAKQVKPAMWVVTILSVVFIILEQIP